MSKVKKENSSKKTAPIKKANTSSEVSKEKSSKKKFDFSKIKSLKKPDISKLKSFNYKPVAKILGMVVIIVGSLALIDLAVQYLNNDYSIAVIDGTRVSRSEWRGRLEKSYGAAMATQLIEENIILLQAKKDGIEITDEEIASKVDEVRTSIGGEELLQSALVANNITMEELEDQIKIELLSKKILEPTLVYTEEDVKSFFDQYSDVIFSSEAAALEEGEQLDYDTYKDKTKEVYIEQLVSSNLDSWLTEKKSQYNIQDNSTDKPAYGFLTTTINLVNNLLNKETDTTESE